jgi:hypothetical protein
VLVCRRDDAQAVKTLVDVLKAGGRDIAHRHAIAFSGGVERQPVTSTPRAGSSCGGSRPARPSTLPAGSIQVLDGELVGEAETYAAGARQELASRPRSRRGAASVLVTTWR